MVFAAAFLVPSAAFPADVSADITELGRTPVTVVCAGVKSILDIPKTLEALETQGVLVAGYRTNEFPAFFSRSSGERCGVTVNTPEEMADYMIAVDEVRGVVSIAGVEPSSAFSCQLPLPRLACASACN